MSIPFLTNIDLNQNGLQNARLQNLPTDPQNPVSGQAWFNTTSKLFSFYNGTQTLHFATEAELEAVQAGAVPVSRTVNGKALSANITLAATDVGAAPASHVTNYNNPHEVTAAQVGAVPTTRTVNNKALSADITLNASDVGARASSWTPTAADVGAVPTSRTVNGKALSSNITLTASDVGAATTAYVDSAIGGAIAASY